MKKGDIIKFQNINKEILLQLTSKPSKARVITCISDEDELLLVGRILNKTKNKYCWDARYKSEKPYIIKENEIILIEEYTKLRLYVDGIEHSEYDTLESAKNFINRIKFNWKEIIIYNPDYDVLYEINYNKNI